MVGINVFWPSEDILKCLEFCTNGLGKAKTPHEMFTRVHILTQNWQFLDTSLMSENGKSRYAVLLCESNSFNTTIF